MDILSLLIGAVAGLILGGGMILLFSLVSGNSARAKAQTIISQAELQSQTVTKEAELRVKEMEINRRAELEKEFEKVREHLRSEERRIDKREIKLNQQRDNLAKQEQIVESTQKRLANKIDNANQREKELTDILERQRKQLQVITGLSRSDAEQRLFKLLEDELAQEVGSRVLAHERKVAEMCDQKAREMLLIALQRFAAAHTAESTTSTVDIPSDEMKGRIIGREGRNIRSFEKETGVDVIIDDTPGVVIVSGFDPVRREVARQSLERLISDGRIHPSRIEEVVAQVQSEVNAFMKQRGTEAAIEVDVHDLHPRIIDYLGRLYFRTSYSQNVLRHSIEVAFISGMIADMIGLDGTIAKRCGLLHDIGKAADHDREGGHPKIGAEILKTFGESTEVVHAALGHHDEITTEHPYTMIVATADACSASRPGARRESLERYIQRMEELESIAREFKGVKQAFAIQAGRELRVLIAASDADDATAAKVCRGIADAFQERLTYPGEIKVTVIRESRFTELAK
ncbi:MAG TPA: ribonuclease Y [Pirellulaceae bacterium]|nr:ribonuclease Y [Pirellulaceae bacterium]HMO92012.1 ribonuclease Y [Pirellulaceae bacterium]HMP68811.1 ribonuclease Y [Pirellulaceae bacterium]